MALHFPKATLVHATLANISHELTTVDDIIRSPARTLPTELLLIIRAHLSTILTTQLFNESTRALAEYEANLQRLLCPDCISYNHDIYGPDVWQWQQFSGPCNCIQTGHDESILSLNPQQFANPYHWLEHHLSLQVTRISPTSLSIWDVVTDVLHRHHCEVLREDLDDLAATQGMPVSPSGMNAVYYRRVVNYHSLKRPQSPPTIRIQPRHSALRFLEELGIGEIGNAGDAFRTEIILRKASQELGLSLELNDVFSSPREPISQTFSWSLRRHQDLPIQKSALLRFSASPVLHSTYSFLSTLLGAFILMPMTIATIALTVICFYSRPVALRVGV